MVVVHGSCLSETGRVPEFTDSRKGSSLPLRMRLKPQLLSVLRGRDFCSGLDFYSHMWSQAAPLSVHLGGVAWPRPETQAFRPRLLRSNSSAHRFQFPR